MGPVPSLMLLATLVALAVVLTIDAIDRHQP
jgi:hypothetical protein